MANRIKPETAFDVVTETGAWVRTYRTELEKCHEVASLYAHIDPEGPFWKTVKPLHEALVEGLSTCAWCVAAIRLSKDMDRAGRDPFQFLPSGRNNVRQHPGWTLAWIMSALSHRQGERPYETLLTTHLCLNVLHDKTPLIINREIPGDYVPPSGSWQLCVEPLAEVITDHEHSIAKLFAGVDVNNPESLTLALAELDDVLEHSVHAHVATGIKLIGPSDVPDKNRYNVQLKALYREIWIKGTHPMLPLAKYLALMTVIWPRWKRIAMLPHIGPSSKHAEPGGIVICEDGDAGTWLTEEELAHVSNIGAVAMWPWLAIRDRQAIQMARRAAVYTPWDQLSKTRNDYQRQTHDLDLRDIKLVDTLTNDELAALEDEERDREVKVRHSRRIDFLESNSSLDVSVVIPVLGRREVFVWCIESLLRQSFTERQGRKLEIIVVEDGVADANDSPLCDELKQLAFEFRKHKASIRFFRIPKNRGRCTARNVGIQEATGDIIAFIDSSMVLDQEFLTEQLLRHSSARGMALLGFKENTERQEYLAHKGAIDTGVRKPDYLRDWKCHHVLSPDDGDVVAGDLVVTEGETVNYMAMTSFLQNTPATQEFGIRNLGDLLPKN